MMYFIMIKNLAKFNLVFWGLLYIIYVLYSLPILFIIYVLFM